jgi:ribosomal protein L11 methyltransferase
MEYIEVNITGFDATFTDMLTVMLFELGYDSFAEEEGRFNAYIPAEAFDEAKLRSALSSIFGISPVQFGVKKLEEKNWNEEWEKSYEPVLIGGRCLVRAPFHRPMPGVDFDLVIEPKMSFGTAHHETTTLMIGWMLDEPVTGKHVVDIGCGTGVLAILAAKMGAKEVRAIDTDPWAFENAKENCLRNHVPQVHVIRGDDGAIPSGPFDVILANINRNILLEQIPIYSRVIRAGGGFLYISGFYEEDLGPIREKALEYGFRFVASRSDNSWTAAKFSR